MGAPYGNRGTHTIPPISLGILDWESYGNSMGPLWVDPIGESSNLQSRSNDNMSRSDTALWNWNIVKKFLGRFSNIWRWRYPPCHHHVYFLRFRSGWCVFSFPLGISVGYPLGPPRTLNGRKQPTYIWILIQLPSTGQDTSFVIFFYSSL